jgi:flavocytochrome c
VETDRREYVINWDEQTDIVVVGSGAAGLSAAIEASGVGASVVVFEKMKVPGGNTRISDGGLAAPGTDMQRGRGIDDSPDLFYEDMVHAGMGLNHPHLARIVAERAADAITWTRDILGVRYIERVDRFGGHSVARCLTTSNHVGADITRAQKAKLREMGVAIRTRCLMMKLHRDGSGAVSGVQIRQGYELGDERSGTTRDVRARRAVILATGGFGNDTSFRSLQNPRLDASIESTNHRGASAEGLRAALRIGALPIHLSWIQTGPWGCPDETGYGRGASFASYAVYPAGILVDPATGMRIVNEWADRRQRSEAMFEVGHPCLGLVDALGAERAADTLRRCLERGTVRALHRVADVATVYGVPRAALEATVQRYNELVEQRQPDPFGKPLDQGDAHPLETAPFYAIRQWPKVHYTPGGVGIDAQARVIDLHGRPIPRLFAAGEVCGGVHGAGRLGSCALTECIVFGRIAGRRAAALRPSGASSQT